MQNRVSPTKFKSNNVLEENTIASKKVDVNILLNRVKSEKKDEFKKNLIITAGAIGTLAVTGLITFI
jgi:hypothetical protein|tara:strand:- start:105 stop:305 length:201 start_codon:yes stop_codon:yes gene_type:complete